MNGGVFRSVAAVAVAVSWSLSGHPVPLVAAPDGLMRWPGRVVRVHDGTHDPLVGEAVAAWDRAGVIRVEEQADPCRPGQACVEIVDQPLADHVGGVTPTRYDAVHHIDAASVVLNTAYPVGVRVGWDGIPTGWALGIRVHELGHALGLVHAPEGTCAVMAPVECGTPTPTAYDAWMLQEAYRLP